MGAAQQSSDVKHASPIEPLSLAPASLSSNHAVGMEHGLQIRWTDLDSSYNEVEYGLLVCC